MAAPGLLPIVFRKSPPYNVTYDWFDSLLNLGYQRFYACCATESGGSANFKYFLTTRSSLDASTGDFYESASQNNANYTLTFELNFDVEFSVPVVVAGADAFINATTYGSSTDMDYYIVYTVYHYDGVTETSLGTKTTQSYSVAASYARDCTEIALTEKAFKAGDILRLEVKVYTKMDPAGAETIKLYYDPASNLTVTDTDSRTVGTDFTLDVPFKIDI